MTSVVTKSSGKYASPSGILRVFENVSFDTLLAMMPASLHAWITVWLINSCRTKTAFLLNNLQEWKWFALALWALKEKPHLHSTKFSEGVRPLLFLMAASHSRLVKVRGLDEGWQVSQAVVPGPHRPLSRAMRRLRFAAFAALSKLRYLRLSRS